MDLIIRKPSKENFCKFVKKYIKFSCIVDVGVQYDTQELRANFIDTFQILIEPTTQYHKHIVNTYSKNNYKLIKKACGNKKGILFLNHYSINSSEITHSQLSEEKSANSIKSEQIESDTLDNILKDIDKYALLKIDVDGAEFDILEGSKTILNKIGFVIIESWTNRISDFIEFFNKHNFELFDIIDICYIRGKLSQVDLVFINKDLNCYKEFDPVNKYNDVYNVEGNYNAHIC